MTRTLVIHPKDPTTDFLKGIYEGKGWEVIDRGFDRQELAVKIIRHQRIIMLGHGFTGGLFDTSEEITTLDRLREATVIDHSFVPLLKARHCVAVWCFASSFMKEHQLSGFSTGMFISEPVEADVLNVSATESEIAYSNAMFSTIMHQAVEFNDRRTLGTVLKYYHSDTNEVIRYNRKLLTFTL